MEPLLTSQRSTRRKLKTTVSPATCAGGADRTPEIRPFCCVLVVLDVLDVCAPDVAQKQEEMPLQQSPHCVGGGSDGVVGSVDAETRRVENRRAKLTDVWQPRKNALS